MACFAILHLWAFPWRPYRPGAQETYYPNPTSGGSSGTVKLNVHEAKSAGGPLGLRALLDAMNIWDVIKAFGRGVRWLFVGVKHRHDDASYQTATDKVEMDMDELSPTGRGRNNAVGKSTDHLPIATEFRRSKFDLMYGPQPDTPGHQPGRVPSDEAAGLIEHAQPMSNARGWRAIPTSIDMTHLINPTEIPTRSRRSTRKSTNSISNSSSSARSSSSASKNSRGTSKHSRKTSSSDHSKRGCAPTRYRSE